MLQVVGEISEKASCDCLRDTTETTTAGEAEDGFLLNGNTFIGLMRWHR